MNNILDQCCSAIITDVCDRMSLEYSIIVGLGARYNQRKMYGKIRTMDIEEQPGSDPNLDLGLDLIQDLKEGEILFVNGSKNFAYFGELLGLYCDQKNISGVVINGKTRDSFSFANYSYPVYNKGYTPIDIVNRGRIKSIDRPIKLKSGRFTSGDFVFCDWEGCVILPQDHLPVIIDEIKNEIKKENEIKSLIMKGDDLKNISKKIKYI